MKSGLYVQVLVGVLAGALVGYFEPNFGVALKPGADAFVKLIRMVLAPVIFTTVVVGVGKMHDMKALRGIGVKALIYFEALSTLALVIGLIVVNLARPGAGLNADVRTLDVNSVAQYATAAKSESITTFLLNIIPSSMGEAFVSGNILQILLIAALFGIALSHIKEAGKSVVRFLESSLQALFHIVKLIMYFSPFGAFAAMAFTVGKYGIGSIVSMGYLLACVYITCILFVTLVFGAVARVSGFSLWRFLAYIKDEIFVVFGTCSSESVLPQLMHKLEAAGCPRPVVGLVLPGGLTFNPDGSAIYFSLGVVFIAQATNTPLSLSEQLLILAVLMVTSKGSAGVAGAGFITLAATLATMDKVPLGGMVLLLGVDRFMAEARSVTNTIGNAVGVVAVAAWDGSLDRAALHAAIGTPLRKAQVTRHRAIERAV